MEKDKKYRRIGWLTAILTHAAVLLLFYFLIAWKEPFPPIPSYGIELSFGDTPTGQGEVAPSAPEPQEENEEVTEEVVEEAEETVEETSQEVVEETEQAEEPVSEAPSPDVVEPKPEVVKQPEPVKAEETKPAEVKKEEPKPSNVQTVNETPSPSQGNTNEPGDEGKKEGTLDDRALYGNLGGGSNGASLDMAGWVWDAKPKPNDTSSETGKLVFRITIDNEGYIKKIDRISGNISPSVELLYRQSIEKLTFSQTSDYKAAPESTGTITFLIQTK
ncbi:MAG: hypothetical protein ACFHWX_10215 [Bacteroidota bacterium]